MKQKKKIINKAERLSSPPRLPTGRQDRNNILYNIIIFWRIRIAV